MEEYVLSAIKKGLKKICFLEHMETGVDYFESTWLTDADFDFYFREGERLRGTYGEQIDILLGVEVGFNPDCIDLTIQRLNQYQWDRIGLSYHFLKQGNGHLNMLSRKQANIIALERIGTDRIITSYLQTLLQAVETIPADVVCHLDAVMRHHPEIIFTDDHLLLVDQLLDTVEQRGMALEINTSGYNHRNAPYPAIKILQMAAARNIPLQAGSDAHHPEAVGQHFERINDLNSLLYP
jgi:histidinol-phosphatase (PHP family)